MGDIDDYCIDDWKLVSGYLRQLQYQQCWTLFTDVKKYITKASQIFILEESI